MLLKLLKAEMMKLRRSPVWAAFIIMPVIPAFLGTLNYVYNIAILQSEWYSLWTQHTLFTCYFFLPVLIGIYCSYLMRLEWNNHNLTRLLSMPIPRGQILLVKTLVVSALVFLSECWIGVLFVISGKMVGISAPVPITRLILWVLFGTLGGMVMVSIQLLLSLFVKSFAIPVGLSFAGGISGLLFLAKDLGHIWPYSLMSYGMNSNAPQQLMAGSYLQFIMTCILYMVLLISAGSLLLAKRDM